MTKRKQDILWFPTRTFRIHKVIGYSKVYRMRADQSWSELTEGGMGPSLMIIHGLIKIRGGGLLGRWLSVSITMARDSMQ